MNKSALPPVNDLGGSVTLDLSGAQRSEEEATRSAIDVFYIAHAELIKIARPELLENNAMVGRLLVMGLISTVETYIRDVFTGIVLICPLARNNIADQKINFSAIDHYGNEYVRSLFEGSSFASKDEIAKKATLLLKKQWDKGSPLESCCEKFEAVCHARHASIHAQGFLTPGNLRALKMAKVDSSILQFHPDLGSVHSCAAACLSFVRHFNTWAYQTLLENWLNNSIFTGTEPENRLLLARLLCLFRSTIDLNSNPDRGPLSIADSDYAEISRMLVQRLRDK